MNIAKRPLLAAIIIGLAVSAGAAQELFPPEPIDCVIRPRDLVKLASLEQGVLTDVLVDRGDAVEAGQIVARLESDLQRSAVNLAELQAANDATVSAGIARVEFRRAEVIRLEKLFERRVAAASNLEEAQIELRLAESDLDSARADLRVAAASLEDARLRLARRDIRSSVAGLVVRVVKSPGEFVDETTEVLTIATLDPLFVEAYLPIEHYNDLFLGQNARIVIGQPLNIERNATVSAIDRVFDAGSGTLGMRLDLPNPNGVLPSGLRCGLLLERAPSR